MKPTLEIQEFQLSWIFFKKASTKVSSSARLHIRCLPFSSMIFTVSMGSLTKNLWVARFLMAVQLVKPDIRPLFPKWHATCTESPDKHNFKAFGVCFYLSIKTWFLIDTCLVDMMAELAVLSMQELYCVFHQDRVVLRAPESFIPKVNSFHDSQEVVLPSFCPRP